MTLIESFILRKSGEFCAGRRSPLPRKQNIDFACRYALFSSADTIVGLCFALRSIFSFGTNQKMWEGARKYLFCSRMICSDSYRHFLRFMNPEAKFPEIEVEQQGFLEARRNSPPSNPSVDAKGNGLLTARVRQFLRPKCKEWAKSQNLAVRHLAARGGFALLGVASVVARVFDGVIGIGASLLSFATLGKIPTLNNIAYRGLQATGVISDLFVCFSKFLNPNAGNFYGGVKQVNRVKEDFCAFRKYI